MITRIHGLCANYTDFDMAIEYGKLLNFEIILPSALQLTEYKISPIALNSVLQLTGYKISLVIIELDDIMSVTKPIRKIVCLLGKPNLARKYLLLEQLLNCPKYHASLQNTVSIFDYYQECSDNVKLECLRFPYKNLPKFVRIFFFE